MRYIKLYYNFIVNNLTREMQYRFDLFMNFILMFTGYGVDIIFFNLIYKNIDSINGWNKYQVLLLVGIVTTIDSIFLGFFSSIC